jgi:uncharacterized protein (DUF433 family)
MKYNSENLLKRIVINPAIFGGKPIIRGMRISVEMVLEQLAQGVSVDEILEDYPDLEKEDIFACFAYAHFMISNEILEWGLRDSLIIVTLETGAIIIQRRNKLRVIKIVS